MRNRRLYVVGVGPGDAELITLKAKRVIDASDWVFYPVKREGEKSIAYDIAKKVCELEGKRTVSLVFPMTKDKEVLEAHWRRSVKTILDVDFETASFITLGDPSIYCTYFYLHERLRPFLDVFFVPGVSSFSACALSSGLPLVIRNEALAVVSASHLEDSGWSLDGFDTVVFMKVPRNRDRLIFLRDRLFAMGFKRVIFASRCTMAGERITEEIPDDVEYISMLMAFRRDGLPTFTL